MMHNNKTADGDNASLIFKDIAEGVKLRLAAYIGRPFIQSHEWSILKKHDFPFDAPENTMMVGISALDTSPLAGILEVRYGYQSRFSLIMKRKEIEEYAWSIVLDSTTFVFGG